MNDSLGDRIKNFYENITRIFISHRTYTLIRVDGRAFHTLTKGLARPFDIDFMNEMDETAKYLCRHISGAKFAFVQSDEISILVTDFDELTTQAWFNNNLQKMCSISASMATRAFNETRMKKHLKIVEDIRRPDEYYINFKDVKWAEFDSRIFQISHKSEVANYFVWRQQDTIRNSVQSVAQFMFSQKELQRKNVTKLKEMILEKGSNWEDYDDKCKYGRLIVLEEFEKTPGLVRTQWVSIPAKVFTQDREYINSKIPNSL